MAEPAGYNRHRQAGYDRALASARLQGVLALEVPRSAISFQRSPRLDSRGQPGQSPVGRTPDPWRALEAGNRGGSNDRPWRSTWLGGRRPPSQSWRTFLQNHAEGIASIDFFVVPTATCRLLFGLLIIRHERRQSAHVAVTASPTADWLARQISEAFPWDTAPSYLIRDRPTASRPPWQNAYIERLIGSVRRECLDHLIVFGEAHLRHVLIAYADYYNRTRTHLSLNKDAPSARPILREGRIKSIPHLGGLHHSYVRTYLW